MTKRLVSLTALIALCITCLSAQDRVPSRGFAVTTTDGVFHPYSFTRHAVGDNDIQIEILYASICHSDLHEAFGHWGHANFPMVPGHEIAGRVVKVGKDVTKFKVGDLAGVGCMVNSCGKCGECDEHREQYCPQSVLTYNSADHFHGNEPTQGGYSDNIVLTEKFAIKIPINADLKKVAPLLCAGITTYSPIRFAGVKSGDKVAVAGFGGLGHMALKYMVALGAEVTVFDITEDKSGDAKRLGAVRYANVNDTTQMKGFSDAFDFILSTIPAHYDPFIYLQMLKFGGKMAIVGLPDFSNMPQIAINQFIWRGGRSVFGSLIGGIKETQQMLDYSVAHNIYPEIEIIEANERVITEAYKNVLAGKVKFRYVIDMQTMK